METTETFGDALFARRQQLNHSQDDAADALKTLQGNISRWEKGVPPLPDERQYRLFAKYLGRTLGNVKLLVMNAMVEKHQESEKRSSDRDNRRR